MQKWALIGVICLLLQPLTGGAATLLEVQGMLRDLGYQPGTVDGQWGGKTRNALKKFQSDRGLPATGKIDDQTVRLLQTSLQAQTAPASPSKKDISINSNAAPGVSAPVSSAPTGATAAQTTKPPARAVADQAPATPVNTTTATNATITPVVEPVLINSQDVIPLQPEANHNSPTVSTPPPEASTNTASMTTPRGRLTVNALKILMMPSLESPSGIRFVHIPGGCFTMGGGMETPREICVHEGASFLIGKYEISQEQWRAVTGRNPSIHARGANYPVENVSWNEIQDFIAKLNVPGQGRYRLPTEAEWEYSARGGTTTKYWWGDSPPVCEPGQINGANFDGPADCPKTIVSVGSYMPNPYGLYDVLGNVWEWVEDVYLPNAYSRYQRQDPVITDGGPNRVFRGGGWSHPADTLTVFYRDSALPDAQFPHLGFRLVYEP